MLLALALAVSFAAPSATARTLGSTVLVMDFVTPTNGYEVVQPSARDGLAKLYRTTDGGRHWSVVTSRLPAVNAGSRRHAIHVQDIRGLQFATTLDGALIIQSGASACQSPWAVFTTTDGGGTWHSAGTIAGEDGPVALAAPASATPWVLIGSCAGTFATWYRDNEGGGWEQAGQFAPSRGQAKEAFNPSAVALQRLGARHATVDIAYYPAVAPYRTTALMQSYVTADGGRQWVSRRIGVSGLRGIVVSVAFASASDGASGLAITQNRDGSQILFWTQDGGRQWVIVRSVTVPESLGTGSFDQVEWVTHSVAYVRMGNVVWRTQDAGRIWVRLPRW